MWYCYVFACLVPKNYYFITVLLFFRDPVLEKAKKVGIVIPTFNRRAMLKTILDQVFNQACGCRLDVIVVVDGSTDGTVEMLEAEYPQVYVVHGTGDWWYTKSMNKGFLVAQMLNCFYVLTLNDDCEIPPDYLSTMLADAARCPGGSILGSLSLTLEKPHRLTFSGSYAFRRWRYKFLNYHGSFTKIDPGKPAGIHPTLVLPGRGMLIPLSLLAELGFFDEKFIQYASDYDFCFRARKSGAEIFITWNTCVFENIKTTGPGTPWLQESWGDFVYSFSSPTSKNYILKYVRFIVRHGHLILLPLTLFFIIFAQIKNRIKHRSR